ncbi:MAG: sulfite exporter TauE/SafE family protein [Thermodesulfobacteriota bacterium]|nr:sulfite exporter TauE/SafE family protein [Thermodesulfobacteriota bacterium]
MIFPVSGVEINPFVPPAVAFVISFFTSMGGVSGAFLLLPFQVSVLGFTSPSVSATNHVFNIVAIPSGVYRYIKEGRMVWPLTWAVIIGTLPGVLIGAIIRIRYLPDPKNFKMFVGLVLLYIGGKMLWELLRKPKAKKGQISAEEDFQKRVQEYRRQHQSGDLSEKNETPKVVVKKFNLSRVVYEFYGQTFDVSTLGLMSLCLVVGIIGGVYGIGGGSIVAPFFISFFGLPVYTIAGAALMGTFVTSVAGVVFYQLIAPFYSDMVIAPDWILGFLFGAGGFAGMYCGARCQKFVPAKIIKWILVGCILFPAIRYVLAFIG